MLAERVNEWTQDGKRQGVLEGEYTLLERLLVKRFGLLSDVESRSAGGTTAAPKILSILKNPVNPV